MLYIQKQNELNLLTEEKSIIITNNLDNDLVQEVNNLFNNELVENTKDSFTKILTFGKIQAKAIYVVNLDKISKKDVISKIASIKEETVILLDTFKTTNYDSFIQELFETVVTKNHKLNKFKSKSNDKIKKFHYIGEGNTINKGIVYGESINNCKDLVNTPYNYLNATDLANHALEFAKYENVTVEILNKKEIEALNMGAFLGVNKGSKDEPKLICVKYQGKATFENPTALVGKGVMYDTGGYSLKTPSSMPGMKVDMAGAAAVLSSVEAIARLELKANVMAIVAATDNKIGDNAILPDDILTAANGKTIEIVSTDAEGRLTLADAVWYAQEQGARKVIDIATLTGAMVMALGSKFTGAFTNNNNFYKRFKEVTEITNEKIWEMPVVKEYHKDLKSQVADMKNKGIREAGASQAAAFIEEFIQDNTEWIHLDVAGTASGKDGATGVMVKTFTELFCI
jgi:leucyl aminopeptidase